MKVAQLQIEKIFLTFEEIELIREVVLPKHLDKARDVFLFVCYTGLRHSDLLRLSKSNVIELKGNTLISFVPQKSDSFYGKSRKKIEIILVPEAVEIIELYKETHF